MEQGGSKSVRLFVLSAALVTAGVAPAHAQKLPSLPAPGSAAPPSSAASPDPAAIDNPFGIPDVRPVLPKATDGEGVSVTLQIFVLMTVITLVPSILIMTTCFARILIVLALLRQAMATPQLPPGQVLLGISLFMTVLIMGPTWSRINQDALQPYLNTTMSQRAAFDNAMGHMRRFMFAQVDRNENQEDIFLFYEYSTGQSVPDDRDLTLADIPTTVLIPAYILSELKTAFVMGFRIYLPFLVIDMVIASILISMGMMMLPPVLISLPFKILLFVLADGWHLVVQTLLYSFDNLQAVT